MTQNNNLSPLPFYRSVEEQNHRLPYVYGVPYPLAASTLTILPFQALFTEPVSHDILTVHLFDKDGNMEADLTNDMTEAGLATYAVEGYGTMVVWNGAVALRNSIGRGFHYLRIMYDTQERYSELFMAVAGLPGYLTLEWWDDATAAFDSGAVVYEGGYRNRLYLKAELSKPEYQYEEEGETRDGYFFMQKQLSEKTYKFALAAPEFLCDVMRLVRLADHVTITDTLGRLYVCDTFLATADWEEFGDVASLECEFETDTVVKKIGAGAPQVRAMDYNADFSDDFTAEGVE